MTLREAIERLQAEQDELRDGATVSVLGLLEIVYRDRPRVALEYRARTQMVLDAAKAKIDAGYPRSAKFFRDVWPAHSARCVLAGEMTVDADEVIQRLCKLQDEVQRHLGFDHAADCFCGKGGVWGSKSYGGTFDEGYRNDGQALAFIEKVVHQALRT